MNIKQKLLISLGLLPLLFSFLFIGLFTDPQDGDLTFFIKYRPTLKQYYYSPEAFHSQMKCKLTKSELYEESLFIEFMTKKKFDSNTNPVLILLLFQITLTFFANSSFILVRKMKQNNSTLYFHFIINVFITGFILIPILLNAEYLNLFYIYLILSIPSLFVFKLIEKFRTPRSTSSAGHVEQ